MDDFKSVVIKWLVLFLIKECVATTMVQENCDKKHPLKCGPNEVAVRCKYECPSDSCSKLYIKVNCISNQTCSPGCTCKEGYLRNKGNCIPVSQCPPGPRPLCNGENEEFIDCYDGQCGPKSCADLGKSLSCPRIRPPCPGGCICKQGYLRDSKGKCIKEEYCPSCGDDIHAVRGCGDPCSRITCSNYKNPPKTSCPDLCSINGCDCRKNYVYDESLRKCVLPKDCTPLQCTKRNEIYVSCYLGDCSVKTCDDLGNPIACPDIIGPCAPGCKCVDGYVRNATGTCIPKDRCPKCGNDPNAVSGCGNYCLQPNCQQNRTGYVCPKYCDYNGCDCRPGFKYDDIQEKCVRPDQCNAVACGTNKTYFECNDFCRNSYCPFDDKPEEQCFPPVICRGGCHCKINYRLNSTGHCILAKECPPINCTRPNEKYSRCPSACLAEQCEDRYNQPTACNTLIENCQPRCVCADNHFRNDKGICVPADQCPPQKKCYGAHEVYIDCYDGECGPKTCADVGNPPPCPRVIPPCKGGCICELGYLRDANGNCIEKDQCPPRNCAANETYVKCYVGCPTNNCPQNDLPPPQCSPPYPCYGGCACKINYRRDISGRCILASECPPINCTRPNELFSNCPSDCLAEDCRDINNQPTVCNTLLLNCQPKCICKKNHFRNDSGICVPANQCPKRPKCNDPYEIYVDCYAGICGPKTCKDLGRPVPCPIVAHPCEGGCICIEGYVRNGLGRCIKKENCPDCGGDPNAISGCGNPCLQPSCSNYKNRSGIICPQYCEVNGCDCRKNYVFDDSQKRCVLPEQCYKVQCTFPHEVYSKCIENAYGCGEPITCDDVGFPKGCAAVEYNGPCNPGCRCEANYVRNPNRYCIPKENCPSCGGDPNAVSGCGNKCLQPTCQHPNKTGAICPLYCEGNGCDCRKGYLFDESINKCVLPKNCNKIQCTRPNEVYTNCTQNAVPCFEPKTCDDVGFPKSCPAVAYTGPCDPGCVCAYNHVRDANGKCIPMKECPSCGGDPYAISGCGNRCIQPTCQKPNKTGVACPRNCEANGCDCRYGYLYDESIKKCVLPKNCNKIQCTRPNEVYTNCTQDSVCYEPNTCDDLGFPKICAAVIYNGPCDPGCVCARNHVRDANGKCILKTDCPSCGGDLNAVSGCGNACLRPTCRKMDKSGVYCPNTQCEGNGCDCRPGYVYDEIRKKCVLPKQCPPQKKCYGAHEVYIDCYDGECGPKTCADVGNPPPCPRVIPPCKGGCICELGYLRDANGNCIEKDQCPPRNCAANETYVKCYVGCPTNNCPQNDLPPPQCSPPYPCYGGCACKINYRRDISGRCILASECPPINCTRPNELFSNCPSDCLAEDCRDINNQPTVCNTLLLNCQPKCICKKNHFRNDSGICVPANQCPKRPKCNDPYEIYVDCYAGICGPKTCKDLGRPVPCPIVAYPCEGGCICIEGYVRNGLGRCVKKENCPDCGGDPNAISGCGNPCLQPSCSNYKNRSGIICPQYCEVNGCDCRKNYVFDDSQKRCVLPEQCYKVQCTFPHEIYSKCIENAYGCGEPITCDDVGFPKGCAAVEYNGPCNPGCRCEANYVRNPNRYCIPKENCPSCGGDPNAVSGCGNKCLQPTCQHPNKTGAICPLYCEGNGCDCRKGYLFDESINKCVLPKNCNKIQCTRPNEVYTNCTQNAVPCFEPKTCDDVGFPKSCPAVAYTGPCDPGCVCAYNHVRDANGKCIPMKECPSCGGDPYAISGCGNRCIQPTCQKPNKTGVACPRNCEANGCDCRYGYLYDESIKKCVLPKNCNKIQCTRPNEVYTNCTQDSGCYEPNTCDDLGFPKICAAVIYNGPCDPGCVCARNHVRDANGKCILKTDCPSCGGDLNAVSGCGNACLRPTCRKMDKSGVYCPNTQCEGNGCDCRPGYVYDEIRKKCVLPKQCPPKPQCNGDHEHYTECYDGECGPKTCDDLGHPIACPLIAGVCDGGCVCDEGYVRDSSGKCIKKENCPSCGGDHNAVSGCGNKCLQPSCTNYKNRTGIVCPLYCEINGCDCRKNYVYDNSQKRCVKPEHCSKVQCTKPNEEYTKCRQNAYPCYVPQTCDQLGFPISCTADIYNGPCDPGCRCIENHVRDAYGNCIPKENCPSCGGDPNKVSGCGNPCFQPTCQKMNKTAAFCPQYCEGNGCDCKPGYLLDETSKKCVLPKDCPSKQQCTGRHERYTDCYDGECVPKTCGDLGKPVACPAIAAPCKGGCICEEGYVRDSSGKCIRKEDCPKVHCTKPNEEYTKCRQNAYPCYVPQTCDQLGFPISCTADIYNGPCDPGCRCIENHVRDAYGNCIPKKNCPSCGGDPNKVSGCGNPCFQPTCQKMNKTAAFCPQYCEGNGCDCKPGYLLDETSKKCVLPKDCPSKKQCIGRHERYTECYDGECVPKTCGDLGKPVACPAIAAPCKGGCICEEGFVRDSSGKCIRKEDCPDCGGDPNAVIGCGNPCLQPTCSNYKNRTGIFCPEYCELNGCDCRKNYVYDESQKRCVKPEQCYRVQCTKPNEEYTKCIENAYPCYVPETCDDVGFPIFCAAVEYYGPCNPGCKCKENYVRDRKGNCIPKEDCPSCGGDSNARSGCGNRCLEPSCQRINKTGVVCPKYCEGNGCDCKPGFLRDENLNICVKPDQCSSGGCPRNETYVNCYVGCPRFECPKNDGPMPICDPPYPCHGGCQCKPNYRRNAEGKCILSSECPPVKCTRQNEEWSRHPPQCLAERCSDRKHPPFCTYTYVEDNQPKCICKKNHFRNDDGLCVPEDQCPC